MSYQQIITQLELYNNPIRTEYSSHYFPRGGQLGYRQDFFYGCSVPHTRTVAKTFQNINYPEISELLNSHYHEQRLCGLMILRFKLEKALKISLNSEIQYIRNFYIDNLSATDHWDLVDQSAGNILGKILVFNSLQNIGQIDFETLDNFRDSNNGFPALDNLAGSSNIWHNRICIITSFAFIKKGNLGVPLSICQYHIQNKHHYIQKATGWVLREIGKHNKFLLDEFLKQNINSIHPICLSYALEKHTKDEKNQIRGLKL